jgi:hypothetical protein
MVWLYRLPIQVGRTGHIIYSTCSNDVYLPSLRLEEGGGISTLWQPAESSTSERIERFIEAQAFSQSYDSAPRPPPPPLSRR